MAHVYCPECGYNNPESARFCARCGAALVLPEEGEATEAFTPPEGAESLAPVGDLGVRGAALVVRSGGGRAGETFRLETSPTTIGRSPECAIFLDDVTVSRKHAVFTQNGDRWRLEDLGSLNGTFVNRERVETAELTDGDELQIGKYRLTFLQR
ncbi:MAG TPA: FHA domain-containing protein [Gaiellaceae bacterium]|nr:FHA domain-containing protein [Gaiellaceae bacterium]